MLAKTNKTKAKRLFDMGVEIHLLPCKIRMGTMQFGDGCVISNKSGQDFDQIVAEFKYYNCNSVTGRYPAYYYLPVERW